MSDTVSSKSTHIPTLIKWAGALIVGFAVGGLMYYIFKECKDPQLIVKRQQELAARLAHRENLITAVNSIDPNVRMLLKEIGYTEWYSIRQLL